jgi:REP element-mobilizing transposase RayT
MTRPRKELVCVDDTPFYHITSRCVRRSFLCGLDPVTGNDYEHRRLFIEQRIHLLSSIFAIDIAAYAVMSNHIHLVVKLNPAVAEQWTVDEVVHRWTCLYKGPYLIQQYLKGEKLNTAERAVCSTITQTYRERLVNLGWFMKCLNEPVARMANKEDGCTGHFWEARYTSQALLTEEALLSCMAYVDLNPVRAGMSETPEASDNTSIRERITGGLNLADAIAETIEDQSLRHFDLPLKPLLNFEGNTVGAEQEGILFSLDDYLELVDTTGRIIREDKRGAIPLHLPPILDRLDIDRKIWISSATHFEKIYHQRFGRKRKTLKQFG